MIRTVAQRNELLDGTTVFAHGNSGRKYGGIKEGGEVVLVLIEVPQGRGIKIPLYNVVHDVLGNDVAAAAWDGYVNVIAVGIRFNEWGELAPLGDIGLLALDSPVGETVVVQEPSIVATIEEVAIKPMSKEGPYEWLENHWKKSEVIFDKGTKTMIEDTIEVGISGAVGCEIAIVGSGGFIFDTEVEGFKVVADRGGKTDNTVEVGEFLATFHVYMVTVCGGIEPEVLPCPEILHVSEEEVIAYF